MGVIYSCECADTEAFAKDAFRVLFPGQDLPKVIPQNGDFSGFEEWLPYIQAAQKAKEKYAYYLTDTEMWDLLKGVRVC